MKNKLKIADARHMDAISKAKQNKIVDKYLGFSFSPESKSGLNSIADKGIQAQILGNFQSIVDSAEGADFIRQSNYGPYVPEIWPIITAWYPEFPLKELISVQDMDKPLAYLFFSRLKAGTNKGKTVIGDVVETPTGSRVIRGNYPTGEIVGETLGVNDFEVDSTANTVSMLTAYAPLVVNNTPSIKALDKIRVKATYNTTTDIYVPLSVNGNVVVLAKKGETVATENATIDVNTGLVTLPKLETDYTEVSLNYVWNLDYATEENLPKVIEDIEMIPVEAKPRALGMQWTLFSEYIKKSQFGVEIREETTKRVLDLLYQYQVRYILDEMYDYAEGDGNEHEVTATLGGNRDITVATREVSKQLKDIATIIEKESGRMEGNRIVTGKSLKNFLETLPDTLFKPAEFNTAFSGPRKIGTFGTFEVYYDTERADDECFMTYRGKEWYDAAYYLATFVPLVPTEAVALGVRVRSSFAAMEAYYYHKPTCVIPFKFKES